MAQEKMRMPSGMGGLVRYDEEGLSKIKFKPGVVVFLIVLIIILEFLLHRLGPGIFG